MPIAPTRTLSVQRSPLILPDEIGGDGCILLMPMNEGSGDPQDYSGYGNHGTRYPVGNPPAWVDGRYGKALSFNGVDQYVDCGTDPFNFGTGDFTLEAWIKTSVGGSVVSKQHAAPPYRGYQYLVRKTDGRLQWSANDEFNFFVDAIRGGDLRDGKLHHVVMVKSLPTGYLIIDGVPYSVDTSGLTGSLDYNIPLLVGIRDITSYPFDGLIDGVRVHSRALSTNDGKAHSVGGRVLKQRELAVVR